MNLIEALEKKRALEEIIQERIDSVPRFLDDREVLSELLTDIDSLIDQFFVLERLVQKSYESTMVSQSESISDVISYADALSKKIEVLKHLLLKVNKRHINTGAESDVDANTVLASIKQYEELRSVLVKKIKDVCFATSLSAPID